MLRETIDFLNDIRESSNRIIEYSEGLSRDEVFTDNMRFDGILHNFHVIGEAVKRLGMRLLTVREGAIRCADCSGF